MSQIAQYSPPELGMGKFTQLVQYNIIGDRFRTANSQTLRCVEESTSSYDRCSGLLEVMSDVRQSNSFTKVKPPKSTFSATPGQATRTRTLTLTIDLSRMG